MKLFPVSLVAAAALTLAAASASALEPTNTGNYQKPKFPVTRLKDTELVTTTGKIDVYDAPKAGSKLLKTYDAGAWMTVLGEATGTEYLYVSPCNACESGYVAKSELRAKSK